MSGILFYFLVNTVYLDKELVCLVEPDKAALGEDYALVLKEYESKDCAEYRKLTDS